MSNAQGWLFYQSPSPLARFEEPLRLSKEYIWTFLLTKSSCIKKQFPSSRSLQPKQLQKSTSLLQIPPSSLPDQGMEHHLSPPPFMQPKKALYFPSSSSPPQPEKYGKIMKWRIICVGGWIYSGAWILMELLPQSEFPFHFLFNSVIMCMSNPYLSTTLLSLWHSQDLSLPSISLV